MSRGVNLLLAQNLLSCQARGTLERCLLNTWPEPGPVSGVGPALSASLGASHCHTPS